MNRNFWIALVLIACFGALAGWSLGQSRDKCHAKGGILLSGHCVRGLQEIP